MITLETLVPRIIPDVNSTGKWLILKQKTKKPWGQKHVKEEPFEFLGTKWGHSEDGSPWPQGSG